MSKISVQRQLLIFSKIINKGYYLRGSTDESQKLITKTQYQSQKVLVYMYQSGTGMEAKNPGTCLPNQQLSQ